MTACEADSAGSADSANWTDRARRAAQGIRRRVLEHTLKANGGYLSQACSAAEILATLYLRVLRLGPSEGPLVPRRFAGAPRAGFQGFTGAAYNGRKGADLDRFIFSPVHYALVLYSALIEVGRLGPDALAEFNQDGSTVEMIGAEHSPGHELTAGSLAQALSVAGGIAYARKRRGDTGRVVVFLSDGEMQEGQTWEAFAALAYHRVDNLAVFIDANGQQCDGLMEDVMRVEPLRARLEAFGAAVREVDGHDLQALSEAGSAPAPGRPLAVVARTDPCRGLPLLEARRPKLHYVRFKSEAEREEYRQALAGLRG